MLQLIYFFFLLFLLLLFFFFSLLVFCVGRRKARIVIFILYSLIYFQSPTTLKGVDHLSAYI